MSAIGPGFAPAISTPQVGPAGARASQAAFFRAAMGQTEPVAPVPPVSRISPVRAESPELADARPTRPGALLDIRV